MILIAVCLLASSMAPAKEEGKTWGQTGRSQALSQIQQFPANELIPSAREGESFDPGSAQERIDKKQIPHSEALDFLRSESVQQNELSIGNEYFLQRSENIAKDPNIDNLEIEEAIEYSVETCKQRDAPYPVSIIRDLQVEVVYDPGEYKDIKFCRSHEQRELYSDKRDAQKAKKRWEKKLAADPTLKSFHVECYKEHKWRVKPCWVHLDDVNNCNNYQTKLALVRAPEWKEVGDSWIYDDKALQALSATPDCTLVKSDCLDPTPTKTINGKPVERQCWKEKLTFLCKLPQPNDCPYIKNQNCELIKKECLEEGPYGCSLWELTFKCYSKIVKRRVGESEIYGLEEDPEYAPNDSFSEVSAKLAVFAEIKKELEDSQSADARAVQVFQGHRMECSKSVAENMMYDCCFSYSGIAKQLGLKTCSADEIALAEMRENGLCRYIGSYDGKFNNLWKSRDEHVFCCFGSKLARILQESAHGQLGIGWDEPKHANCRGLTLDEIASLDFTKMDFSELYADYERKLPENFRSRLETFENRVKEKVKQHDEQNKT